MNKKIIEQKIKDYLLSRTEIISAYIFGSFVTREKFSNIDIAVYLNPAYNFNNLNLYPFGYESEILGKLDLILKTDKVDLIILNKADLLILTRVYNKGKLLFEKDRFLRIRIENKARKEYIDTESYRKLKSYYLNKYINERLKTLSNIS